MTGTGRQHGFESHAEQLLLALHFLGVREVVSQPLRMRFDSAAGPREHITDFLAVASEETWLLNVRPADRIEAAAGSSSPPRPRRRWPADNATAWWAAGSRT